MRRFTVIALSLGLLLAAAPSSFAKKSKAPHQTKAQKSRQRKSRRAAKRANAMRRSSH